MSDANPFILTRTFNAPRPLVFAAWTQAEHLAKWFGPKGFEMVHLTNDPRPGGMLHYGMKSPTGQIMWGRWVYREITPPERLVIVASFSDEHRGVTRHPMAPTWPLEMLSDTTFADRGGKTEMTLRVSPFNATDVERQTFEAGRDGMKGGWAGTMEQLDAYLAAAKG
jgi:uncharacterized protein YndB with AHSA1/START domain